MSSLLDWNGKQLWVATVGTVCLCRRYYWSTKDSRPPLVSYTYSNETINPWVQPTSQSCTRTCLRRCEGSNEVLGPPRRPHEGCLAIRRPPPLGGWGRAVRIFIVKIMAAIVLITFPFPRNGRRDAMSAFIAFLRYYCIWPYWDPSATLCYLAVFLWQHTWRLSPWYFQFLSCFYTVHKPLWCISIISVGTLGRVNYGMIKENT
jgi:hypothetical protein